MRTAPRGTAVRQRVSGSTVLRVIGTHDHAPVGTTSPVPDEEPLTDAELCEMALAAETDRPLDADARPLADPSDHGGGPLPSWYMPAPRTGNFSTWHRVVAAVIIAAFVVINALGLCITYGVLEIA